MSFNAWHQPWLPVARGTTRTRISLREFYTDSSTYTGLGAGLSPLDHDALHRLLAAVGAVIVRELSRRDLARHAEAGTFPAEGIATFEAAYAARFELAGHQPFLQRWDKTALDIEVAAVAKKKPTEAVLFPVAQLHPHEPGGSSAQWAVRRSTLDAADPAVLTLLLVTSFFHVRDGNGRDLWGGKAAKGSTATWTTNPMAVFLLHQDNLGCTVYANTPREWIEDTSRGVVPMFLDHTAIPADFITRPRGLYRCTYSRTLPLVYWHEGRPVGFTLGPTPYPVPTLAVTKSGDPDEKESLKALHLGDHTILVVQTKTDTGTEDKPRAALSARLTSTEGFDRWFRVENGIAGDAGALARWLQAPRALEVPQRLHGWSIGVCSTRCDPYGGRLSADWSTLPARAAGSDANVALTMQVLTGFASDCRRKMLYPARLATGDSKPPAFLENTQQAFYTVLEDLLGDVLVRLASQTEGALADAALGRLLGEIAAEARGAFIAGTEPLAAVSIERVSNACAYYERAIGKLLADSAYRPAGTNPPTAPSPTAPLPT